MKRIWIVATLVVTVFRGAAAQTPADSVALSLQQALARAMSESEEVKLARSQVDIAHAQIHEARAGVMPQINANLGYTRTLESQFNTSFELPDSLKFEPDSLASIEERLRYLEDKAPIAGLVGIGSLFSGLPFGREHMYAAQLSGTQTLFSGGRTGAALAAAKTYREAAEFQLSEQLADIELSVRSAYYRAQFAQELERIAAAAVEQAEKFLEQERLRERTGASSELDVLRAEVSLANLKPQLVQARNAAELASLDLKRLVNIPAAQPLKLTTELTVPPAEALAAPDAGAGDRLAARGAIAASERMVHMRELAVRVAKGAFLPSIGLSMNYGRIAYPNDPFKMGGVEWRTDWNAALGIQVPIFDGLRRNAQLDQAQAQLNQARLQLAQLREGIQIQYQQASGERQRAASAIAARQQTVTQAQRVYDLTVLRYDRGLATQLEVTDARLALLSARTNLAQALSDYYVAEATVARTLGGNTAGSR